MTGDALRVLAPGADETALLRACVPSGGAGRDAFERWAGRLGDPVAALRDAPPHLTALLPVLMHAAETNGAMVDRALMTVMRAAWTHEELRGREFEAACRDVLAALDEPVVVLPGVALVPTVYAQWPLRHCHDLDLLVRAAPGGSTHPSGVPVARHTGLGGEPWLEPPADDAWRRAAGASLAGLDVRVLGAADALVHVCVHAVTRPDPPAPRWALDAWWIAARGDVDWAVVTALATPRLAPVLSAMLGWLADELGAPVPAEVLADLRDAAARADRLSLELALFLARRRVGAAGLVRRAGRDRRLVLRSTLRPSADYLRLHGTSRVAWMRNGAAGLLRTRGGARAATR